MIVVVPQPTPGSELGIRKLTFREFKESLVRCAIVAYSKISDASIIDKIRGLFLYMWRSINTSVPRAFDQRRSVSTYHGDLMSGAMLFNKRFTQQWAADGYRCVLFPVGCLLRAWCGYSMMALLFLLLLPLCSCFASYGTPFASHINLLLTSAVCLTFDGRALLQ